MPSGCAARQVDRSDDGEDDRTIDLRDDTSGASRASRRRDQRRAVTVPWSVRPPADGRLASVGARR